MGVGSAARILGFLNPLLVLKSLRWGVIWGFYLIMPRIFSWLAAQVSLLEVFRPYELPGIEPVSVASKTSTLTPVLSYPTLNV